MSVVESNLMTCQTSLRRWSKESFCNITRAVRDKKKEIEEAEKQAIRGACAAQMHYLRAELRDLLSREEKLWQQRSKQHWLKATKIQAFSMEKPPKDSEEIVSNG